MMDVFCGKIMDKFKLVWSKTNRWHRAFLLLFLVELRIFPSGQIGFTCNDPALSHPFTGDTVSWKLLLATCILLPLVILCKVTPMNLMVNREGPGRVTTDERWLSLVSRHNYAGLFGPDVHRLIPEGSTLTWATMAGINSLCTVNIGADMKYILQVLIVERKYHSDKTVNPKQLALLWYREHLFGVLINLVTVQVLKAIVGSPRPHFFDTCSPKEALTCQDSEYVSTYTCTKAHWLSQSDRSFPSGHTSLAIHTGFLLAYYLHRRISPRSSGVVSAQVVLLLTAVYCGVSRVTDHRHHWWDVLAGVVLAAPILVYTVMYSCSNFECPAVKTEKEQPNGDGRILSNTESFEAKTT